ncbi:MAG: dolichol-phosphate mannosyltransferase [Thermoplasmata archaeon]|nr:dolichol-phosphate mannosyltransferase [Thermoplasmata archaeon]
MPLLSVVIPTYNEAANIAPLLAAMEEALAGVDAEFVVVDDNSKDGTAELARKATPRARVIVRTAERGLATAVVRGIAESKGTFVAVMDADFQHPPATVRAMLDRAVAADLDLVVGSRYAAGGSEGSFGLARRTISKGARALAKLALPPIRRHRLTDPMSGLFLVRRERIDPDALRPTGYKILLEVLGRARLERVEEVGYTFQDRRGGASKLGSKVIVQYLAHVAMLGLEDAENQRLLRFLFVGASGVIVNFLFFTSLWLAGVQQHLALLAGIEASILSNFILNDLFTFRDRANRPWIARLGLFHLVSLGSAVLQFVTATLLADLLGVPPLVAVPVGIVAGVVPNYLGNLKLTYAGKDGPPARAWVPLAVLIAVASGLYLTGLGPAQFGPLEPVLQGEAWGIKDIYFDESYYVVVAHQMDQGVWTDPCHSGSEVIWGMTVNKDLWPVNFEHPPLAKLIMAASVHAYETKHGIFEGCRAPDDDHNGGRERFEAWKQGLREDGNAWAWRAPSAVFGVATVVFAALAARRIYDSYLAMALAGSFVVLDNLVLSSSRIALLDIYATGFAVIAVYCATFASRRGVLMTALFLGLGFASKFYVLFAAPPILLLSLWIHWRAGVLRKRCFDLHLLAYPLGSLGVLVATYTPWWVIWIRAKGIGYALWTFVAVQAGAIKWDATGQQEGNLVSQPNEWLLMTTPYQYISSWRTPDGGETLYRFIYALGNPFLWWAACVAVLYVLVDFTTDWLTQRRHAPNVPAILATAPVADATPPMAAIPVETPAATRAPFLGPMRFFASLPRIRQALLLGAFLPLLTYLGFLGLNATGGRDMYLFYMTLIVPLMAIALAGLLAHVWFRFGWPGRIVVMGVCAAVAFAFVWFLPVTIYNPEVSEAQFHRIFDLVPWMRECGSATIEVAGELVHECPLQG